MKKFLKVLIIYIFSYLPIVFLLYVGLISKNFNIDIRTLLLTIIAFIIKDIGIDMVIQMIPFKNIYLDK